MKIAQKLSSRKLWAAVLGILTGLAIIFGADGETVQTIAGAIVTMFTSMSYIITEGAIDAKNKKPAETSEENNAE